MYFSHQDIYYTILTAQRLMITVHLLSAAVLKATFFV